MKLYQGKRRNHPTAKLRRFGRKLREVMALVVIPGSTALGIFAMLYLSVR